MFARKTNIFCEPFLIEFGLRFIREKKRVSIINMKHLFQILFSLLFVHFSNIPALKRPFFPSIKYMFLRYKLPNLCFLNLLYLSYVGKRKKCKNVKIYHVKRIRYKQEQSHLTTNNFYAEYCDLEETLIKKKVFNLPF